MRMQCIIAFAVLSISPLFAGAQCAMGQQMLTYDSTLTGYGNAYAPPYTFTFPQFNGALGTLSSVAITSTVSVNFTFSYENEVDSARSVPQQKIYRSDYVTSSVLPADLTYDQVYNGSPKFGPYLLAAADAVAGGGADYVSIGPTVLQNNNTIINSTITDPSTMSAFTGTGSIGFDYTTYTYSAPVITKFTYRSVANENIRFAISYAYCPLSPLAQDILSFTASNAGNDKAYLQWTAANEMAGHVYILEKSADGVTFSEADTFQALSSGGEPVKYSYTYYLLPGEGQLYFRVREMDQNGAWKYSAIRQISAAKKKSTGISIYPNPSNGLSTLAFGNAEANWDVSIVSTEGRVLQHFSFDRTSMVPLDLRNRLAKGLYMVKALNRQTREQFVEQLVIE